MANEPMSQGPKGPKGRRSGKNKRNGKYARQRVRTTKNKLASCQRHIVQHPKDTYGHDQYLVRLRVA